MTNNFAPLNQKSKNQSFHLYSRKTRKPKKKNILALLTKTTNIQHPPQPSSILLHSPFAIKTNITPQLSKLTNRLQMNQNNQMKKIQKLLSS